MTRDGGKRARYLVRQHFVLAKTTMPCFLLLPFLITVVEERPFFLSHITLFSVPSDRDTHRFPNKYVIPSIFTSADLFIIMYKLLIHNPHTKGLVHTRFPLIPPRAGFLHDIHPHQPPRPPVRARYNTCWRKPARHHSSLPESLYVLNRWSSSVVHSGSGSSSCRFLNTLTHFPTTGTANRVQLSSPR